MGESSAHEIKQIGGDERRPEDAVSDARSVRLD